MLDVRRDDEQGLVTVRGEVDLSTVRSFEAHLAVAARRAPADLVVDLGGTTFLCVRGSGALARHRAELVARHRRLLLRGAGRQVRRVLHLCGLALPAGPAGPEAG